MIHSTILAALLLFAAAFEIRWDPLPPLKIVALQNGGFEEVGTAGAVGVPGWVLAGNVTVGVSAVAEGTRAMEWNGTVSSDTMPNGMLSQTVWSASGELFVLTCKTGTRGSMSASQNLQLTVQSGTAGVAVVDQHFVSTHTGGSIVWTARRVGWVATGTSLTVTFSDRSLVTTGVDSLLDDVVLTRHEPTAGAVRAYMRDIWIDPLIQGPLPAVASVTGGVLPPLLLPDPAPGVRRFVTLTALAVAPHDYVESLPSSEVYYDGTAVPMHRLLLQWSNNLATGTWGALPTFTTGTAGLLLTTPDARGFLKLTPQPQP